MCFLKRCYYFDSQVEAACAYDLAVLASGGLALKRATFKHAPDMYSSAQVQAMAQYLQAVNPQKQQHDAQAGSQHLQANSAGSQGAEQTPPAAAAGALPAAPGTWDLVRQLLGRPHSAAAVSRGCSGPTGQPGVPDRSASAAGAGRLPFWRHSLPGDHEAVSRPHGGGSCTPAAAAAGAAARSAGPAASTQPADLQGPGVDAEGRDVVCCSSTVPRSSRGPCAQHHQQQQTAWGGSSSSISSSGERRVLGVLDPAAVVCLQRAALRTPEVLLLSAGKAAQRLHVLQGVSQEDAGVQQQLRHALSTGSIGRWLCSGMDRAPRCLASVVPPQGSWSLHG